MEENSVKNKDKIVKMGKIKKRRIKRKREKYRGAT